METLEQFIAKHRKSDEKRSDFAEYLYSLMSARGIDKPSQVYLKANITKQAWSAIIAGKVSPSLNTCVKLAFALKTTNHECKYLLKKAGYTLASSSEYALIIRYCIENGIYDIYALNDYLEKYGYAPIV